MVLGRLRQSGRQGPPVGGWNLIAPSKLKSWIRNPEDWESRQRGRGAEGQEGQEGARRRTMEGKWKARGARCWVRLERGMWTVEGAAGGRKVGGQTQDKRCTTLTMPHHHHRLRRIHSPSTVHIRYRNIAQTHITNPQPHLSICQSERAMAILHDLSMHPVQ